MENIEKTILLFEINAKIEIVQDVIIDLLNTGEITLIDKYVALRSELQAEKKQIKQS